MTYAWAVSLLLDVPEHRGTGRDEPRDVAAGGGTQTPFAERDVGRPLGGLDLRGLGDLLQPGRIGLAGEAVAELFHLRIAGPAIEGLVARGIEVAVRHRVGEIHGRGRDQVSMPAALLGRALARGADDDALPVHRLHVDLEAGLLHQPFR